MSDHLRVRVGTRDLEVPEGTSAAAASAMAGLLRRSVTGELRAPVCGIGVCMECRTEIDGRPHQCACRTLCRDGMRIATGEEHRTTSRRLERREADVVVIGAGPAGIAAALAARGCGRSVVLLDQEAAPGGQGWRARRGRERLRLLECGVHLMTSAEVTHLSSKGAWIAQTEDAVTELLAPATILATGARELLLPFPGWTLPGVVGAGGLQALVEGGLPIAGKAVLVAGSGPLLFAAAATLRRAGARVRAIAEQAGAESLALLREPLLAHPRRAWQALGLLLRTAGVPFLSSTWPASAQASGGALRVHLARGGGQERVVDCDYLACAFGLVPNTELAELLGCSIEGGKVVVDTTQATTVPGVWCAGEMTGIGGADRAWLEGTIAGYAAAGREGEADGARRARSREDCWAAALSRAYLLRDELRRLSGEDTHVCRCEDVPLSRLRAHTSWREARLHTRCGMGACQGRTCGPATRFLLGWDPTTARPPARPVPIDLLAAGE